MPTIAPPTKLAKIPINDIPPFVPLGTRFHVVISKGSDRERTLPSSEAHVSPLQQAIINNRELCPFF